MSEADRIRSEIHALRPRREEMPVLEYLMALKSLGEQLAAATAQEVKA